MNDAGVSILIIGKKEYRDSVISEALKRNGYRLTTETDLERALRIASNS